MSVAKANHPGRWTALLLDHSGKEKWFAKIALTEGGREALRKEALAIPALGKHLRSPLEAPSVVAQVEGLLVMNAIQWRPRLRPWKLPETVAHALGEFHRSTGSGPGLVHGDFAPWNLLDIDGRWLLADWEEAREEDAPFFDVYHYLVQSYSLLGRPSVGKILDGLSGKGWIASALHAFAAASGTDMSLAREGLVAYLNVVNAGMDARREDHRRGMRARAQLSTALRDIA